MKVAIISSGSKANCAYIEHDGEAILIDCGLTAKECRRRMDLLQIDALKIKAILITHEHSDHLRGVSVLSRQLALPVFANISTSKFIQNVYALENFMTGEVFEYHKFQIYPFSVVHDAVDPVGFSVIAGNSKYTQATDLGRVTNIVREAAKDSDFLLLESNYDQQMLQDCEYPWQLKQRISSAHGHLSNDDAATFLQELKTNNLKHVVLGHLSENSNQPNLAIKAAANFNDLGKYQTFQCGSVANSLDLVTF